MKNELWRGLSAGQGGRVMEVIAGMKQIALILEVESGGGTMMALYRPEKGVIVSVHPLIPKPAELYRDVAYSRLCSQLGWEIAAPVVPWELEPDDNGVLRPYWRTAKKREIYHFEREGLLVEDRTFWLRVAVADYVFGVADRVVNDILIVDDQPVVVDSGFSFLPGLDFDCQQSLVRERLKGEPIEPSLLFDLGHFEMRNEVSGFIGEAEVYWVHERIRKITFERVIL